MTLDLSPGTIVLVDGQRYTVEEHSSFHEVDFRLDLVRLAGRTPAHERWLIAVLPEPLPMLMQRLEHDWLAPPAKSFAHEGETFVNIYRGTAHRVRRARTSRAKEGRIEYAVFRADSGRVLLTITQDEDVDAWIGAGLSPDALQTLPAGR